jgi:hypothetical protein
MTQAARQLGVNKSCVSRALRRITYAAVGA